MKEIKSKIDRRNFIKTVGAAGLGSVLAGCRNKEQKEPNTVESDPPRTAQEEKFRQMPKRKLGKTGIEVPCLSLGTNRLDNQIILRSALRWGITYWDTANSYVGGNSELSIGKFLSKNPELRKKLFIVSKASGARKEPDAKAVVAAVQERLQTSLKRMNTGYVDLYYGVHGLSEPGQLTDELKQWAEDAKRRKLIRFFGFSTHNNVPQNLIAAVKLGWIDVIMARYNFRHMHNPQMRAAIDACYKAGIGIIAMKTVALSHKERGRLEKGQEIETEEDKKLLRHFLDKGLTVGQAKIKFVLEDKRISSACVGMRTVANIVSNAEVVLGKTQLTKADMELFRKYARATYSDYCAGCAYICNSALPDTPYVSDIMRYLMYYNSYGDKDRARELFARIPNKVRSKLLSMDYSLAEARCPQHLPIGKLVTEAVNKLA